MAIIKALCVALSTYSVLPAPRREWTEEHLRYALSALPAVGVVIGGALLLWHALCVQLAVSSLLFAAVATVLPLLITGGIHLDGFCDTVDALASHQPPARKLEIMKDPHPGAFAVMYCAAYLIVCLGLYAQVYGTAAITVVSLLFVLSRALATLSALTIQNAREAGMLASFTRSAAKRTAILICLCIALLCGAAMLALHLWAGVACLALCGLTFLLYRRLALRQFGGATGDTTGFFLQLCELTGLLGVVAGALIQGAC